MVFLQLQIHEERVTNEKGQVGIQNTKCLRKTHCMKLVSWFNILSNESLSGMNGLNTTEAEIIWDNTVGLRIQITMPHGSWLVIYWSDNEEKA